DARVGTRAGHEQQLDVSEVRMALAADFDEEGVEIDVEDAGDHVLKLAAPLAFARCRSPARAPERLPIDARRLPRPRRHWRTHGGASRAARPAHGAESDRPPGR